jgi:hypothetical protein
MAHTRCGFDSCRCLLLRLPGRNRDEDVRLQCPVPRPYPANRAVAAGARHVQRRPPGPSAVRWHARPPPPSRSCPHPTTNPTRQAKLPGRDPVLNLPVSIHLPPGPGRRGDEREGAPLPVPGSPPAGAPTAPALAAAYVGRAAWWWQLARGVPSRRRTERSRRGTQLPHVVGGLAVFTAPPTVSFLGLAVARPPSVLPAAPGREGQHACVWSVPAVAGAARALPHWARTFRAPSLSPVGRSWALGHGSDRLTICQGFTSRA